jgi:hypothetical protein
MMKRSMIPITVIFLVASRAFAYTATSAQFLNNTLSVRQAGMAGNSLGRPDALAPWANPALQADLEAGGAIALHGGVMADSTTIPFGLSFGVRPSEYFAFGGFFYSNITSFAEIDSSGVQAGGYSSSYSTYSYAGSDTVQQYSFAGGLTLAGQWGWGGLGLTVKGINEYRSADSNSTGGVMADLGTRLRFGPVGLQVAVRNIGGKLDHGTYNAGSVSVPTEARLGANFNIRSWGLIVGVEGVNNDAGFNPGLGLEYWPVSMLGIRAGLNGIARDDMKFGVGLSFASKVVGFDLSYNNAQIGSEARACLSFNIGKHWIDYSDVSGGTSRVNRLYRSGNMQGALAESKTVLAEEPDNWQVWETQGRSQQALGDNAGAMDSFNRSLAINPRNRALAQYVARLKAPVAASMVASSPALEPMATLKPGQVLNIAVAELKAEGTSASDAAVITGLIRNSLVRFTSISVVDKSNMDRVLSEQAFQQTGCTTQECAVKLGKLLNVRCMVVGSFGKLLSSYFLNVNLVDVENGRIISAESEKVSNIDEIERSVGNLSNRIAIKATNWYAANQKKD